MTAFDSYQNGNLSAKAFGHPVPETWNQKNWQLSFQDRARKRVFEYVKPRLEKTDKHVTFSEDEVYVVWFTYVLGNWKALVSTTLPDGMYYEVTYSVDKKETYVDAYKKFDNIAIKDDEEVFSDGAR